MPDARPVIHQAAIPWASLPTPAKLEAYDRARPGTSDWILSMVEQHAAHSRRIELEAHRVRRLGYFLAFCSIVILGGVAIYFVARGAPTQGAAVLASGAVAITGIFVTGRSVNRAIPPPKPRRPDDDISKRVPTVA